ncbi:MAG TPA: MAPEG family protein [Steroidobacteraceae bacterium]|nr:MAPEG family protein [Steroidobacteraceae bacterium]
MNLSHPLLPAVGMVLVTAAVWVRLYFERIGEMRQRRIPASQLATSRQAAASLQNVNSADNLRNLFEIPVLFYTLCLALFVTKLGTPVTLAGCWLYVLLRATHSAIHCTYNKVMHRFYVYAVSTALLFLLWVVLAAGLLRSGGA